MQSPGACACGCRQPGSIAAHRIAEVLAHDDLDRAMTAGLLECEPCEGCTPACRASLLAARDSRRFALAARERFRSREARLARRQAERRGAPAPTPPATPAHATARLSGP
jgi:hypothetical protein